MPTWVTLATAAAFFVGAEIWYWIEDQWSLGRRRREGGARGEASSQTVMVLTVTDDLPIGSHERLAAFPL